MPTNKSKNPNQQNTAASVGEDYMPLGILNAIKKAESLQFQQGYRQLSEQMEALQTDPIYMIGKQFPGQFAGTNLEKDFNQQVANLNRKIRRQEILEQSSQTRAQSTIASQINISFAEGSINGQALKLSSDPNVQLDILRQTSSTTSADISRRMRASDERLRSYEKEAHDININKLIDRYSDTDPAAKNRLSEIFHLRESEIKERATLHGIAKAHKDLGLDEQSINISRIRTEAEANKVISSGGSATKEAQAFQEALEQLKAIVDTTSEDFEKLNKEVDKAQKAFHDAGGGGGEKFLGMGGGTWAKMAGYANIAGAAGDLIQKIGVNQAIQNINNRTNYANIENEKYATYKAARGGDVAAQLALMQFDAAQGFGRGIKITAGVGETLSGYGWGLSKIAGGAAVGLAGAGSTATGVGAIPGLAAVGVGGGAVISGTSDLVTTTSSLISGTNTSQAYKAGRDAYMNAIRSINAIPAEQMQGLRDFYVGGGQAAQNMGAGGEAFLSQVTGNDIKDRQLMQERQGIAKSKTLLERMADANVSPEQMIKMAQLGTNALGSQFNTGQVFNLRQLEKANLGSMELNMQRMGTLTSAGANNPQGGLESVIGAAMTKSLTDAPTLNKMVENTAALVSQTQAAAAGIDVTGVTAASLASLVDPNAENKIFATQRAMTVAEMARSAGTNVSTTFSGMMNTSRISAATGLSGEQAIIAGGKDVSIFKALQSDADAAEKMRKMGLGQMTPEQAKELATKMVDLKQRQVAEGSGVANALGGLDEETYQKLKAGTLSNKDIGYDKAARIASLIGYGNVDEYGNAIRAGDVNAVPGTKLQELKDKGAGEETKKADFLRTDQFKQLSQAAGSAATNLSKIGDALTIFTELQTKYSKDGDKTEQTFSKSAVEAADSFKNSTGTFDKTVTRLESVVNAWAKQAGISTSTSDDKTEKAGSGRGPGG